MNIPAPLIENKYAAWIVRYLLSKENAVLGMCKAAVQEMTKEFPELIAVPGHVWVPGWGKRGHWWCKTPDGKIVDPTASQFPAISAYEPWNPNDEVRVGRCMNCGDDIWAQVEDINDIPPHKSVCSDECGDELAGDFGVKTGT